MWFEDAFPRANAAQLQYARLFAASRVADVVYRHFGILDAKASALLRFNGIAVAILALIALDPRGAQTQEEPTQAMLIASWASIGALLLFIVSTFFCALVVRLYWYRLADLRQVRDFEASAGAAAAAPDITGGGGFQELNRRTAHYKRAYRLAFLGALPLFAALLIKLAPGL